MTHGVSAGSNGDPEDRKKSTAASRATKSGTENVPEPPKSREQPQRDLYPFIFSTLREGDFDPTLNKTVLWLIDSDKDFIVYLDEDNFVEWNMNSNDMLGPETGPYLNQVGRLEAVDTSYLSDDQVISYQRMIA